MTSKELYGKLQKNLGHLGNACVDDENTGGAAAYYYFNEETQSQDFETEKYYWRMIDSAIHEAADRCEVSSDDKIFANALKACKLKY